MVTMRRLIRFGVLALLALGCSDPEPSASTNVAAAAPAAPRPRTAATLPDAAEPVAPTSPPAEPQTVDGALVALRDAEAAADARMERQPDFMRVAGELRIAEARARGADDYLDKSKGEPARLGLAHARQRMTQVRVVS